jgi:hypothetical protein
MRLESYDQLFEGVPMSTSAYAIIGWGINFVVEGEYGEEVHESLAKFTNSGGDIDEEDREYAWDAFEKTEWCDTFELVDYGYSEGYDEDRLAILFTRSKHEAMPTQPETIEDTLTLVQPLAEELAQLNAALDYMGYAGPRKVELLLLAKY